MQPKSISVKNNVAVSAQNLATSAFLLLCCEQIANTSRAASGSPGVSDCAPHFERMLYDNSQLARVYLHVWMLTSSRSQAVAGSEFFCTITEEIPDHVVREMRDPG